MERSPFGADVSSNGSRRVESAKSTAVVFPRRQSTSGPFRGAVCVCVCGGHVAHSKRFGCMCPTYPIPSQRCICCMWVVRGESTRVFGWFTSTNTPSIVSVAGAVH